MRYVVLFAMSIMMAVACTKPVEDQLNNGPDLTIVAADTELTAVKGQVITSRLTCQAPNLCYSFSRFDVSTPEPNVFHIRAKANYPNQSGSVICAQAIYRIDTTLRIPVTETGTYYLRFFNGNQVFKTDTVVVQ